MIFSHLIEFIWAYWQPILITSGAGLVYSMFIIWMWRIKIWDCITLFITWIIVVTCIFLPFSWSINHSGGWEKEIFLFFFTLNIEWNNFIKNVTDFLANIDLSKQYTGNAITFFLAFLEELFKLTLLILCMRKSLRLPVMIMFTFLIGTYLNKILWADSVSSIVIWVSIFCSAVLWISLWILLWRHIQSESVVSFMVSISIVSLWFAYAENLKYIYNLSQSWNTLEAITQNAILRSIFWYLSHIFFGLVAVALYARWRFAFLRAIDSTWSLSLAQKALGWRTYTKLKSIQGFWLGVIIATIIHGVYNMYISEQIIMPSIILMVGFVFLELFVFHALRNNTKYWNIENYLK